METLSVYWKAVFLVVGIVWAFGTPTALYRNYKRGLESLRLRKEQNRSDVLEQDGAVERVA